MILGIIAAAALPVVLLLLLVAAGYDINEKCENSEECEKCPFPRCKKSDEESEVKK